MIRTLLITIIVISSLTTPTKALALDGNQEQSIIIEVEGDPVKHKEYLETYYPFIEVITTYTKLFNGLALQGSPDDLAKMSTLDFVKALHTVQTYTTTQPKFDKTTRCQAPAKNVENAECQAPAKFVEDVLGVNPDVVMPHQLNNTKYTGEGVVVGVVDTGIAYNHPDLKGNYLGGYDVVDLDDDPMETQQSEGIPTEHGSHVAGIIAANGSLKGVAPHAKIRAYRALGPGGTGTSIQVIAAMEQAVKDGVDIINLSLGNTVNGPDYPTSVAVNRAIDLGVAVVIANGNSGPDNWTVGAPATASKALAVGAFAAPQTVPMLYDTYHDKKIPITTMVGSVPWKLTMDYEIATTENLNGKIALIQRGKIPFYNLAKQAEDNGAIAAIIYNNEKGSFNGAITGHDTPVKIPVASVSKKAGEYLTKFATRNHPYLDTIYMKTDSGIATFSSRGPVTVNWDIKPDIIAPGTNILSTVPGGYMPLQGTSMAAPHVAGVIALIKEAHPNWSNKKIFSAIKTTAIQVQDENGKPIDPIIQGAGKLNPKRAIQTPTIIYHSSLAFGKINDYHKTQTIELTVENTSDQPRKFSFEIPNKQKGLSWNLPLSFTVEAHEKLDVPVELGITSPQLKKGIHQGWLTLQSDHDTYHLPYLFINQTADYPKATGFEFTLKPFSEDEFVYRLYLTEEVRNVSVELYDPHTLIFESTLLEMKDTKIGMNEGFLDKKDVGEPGQYLAIISVQLATGKYESYETEVFISPGGG